MNKYRQSIPPKEFTNSYWCPDCGKLAHVTSGSFIKFDLESEGEIEITSANIDFNIVCTKCDSYMLPIDYLISKQIKKLNKIGIQTAYCCAGHLNMAPDLTNAEIYKFSIDCPYISFVNTQENERCKLTVKRLLLLQEFGFISIEDYNKETWVIRASVNSIETFSDVQKGFINFVDCLITYLDDAGK